MLREVVAAAEQQNTTLQGAVQQRDAEIDKLRLLIKRLLRQQFGRRSEQLIAAKLNWRLCASGRRIGHARASKL